MSVGKMFARHKIIPMNPQWLGLYEQVQSIQNPVIDGDRDFKTPFLTYKVLAHNGSQGQENAFSLEMWSLNGCLCPSSCSYSCEKNNSTCTHYSFLNFIFKK